MLSCVFEKCVTNLTGFERSNVLKLKSSEFFLFKNCKKLTYKIFTLRTNSFQKNTTQL
jgi:hypothetical protein